MVIERPLLINFIVFIIHEPLTTCLFSSAHILLPLLTDLSLFFNPKFPNFKNAYTPYHSSSNTSITEHKCVYHWYVFIVMFPLFIYLFTTYLYIESDQLLVQSWSLSYASMTVAAICYMEWSVYLLLWYGTPAYVQRDCSIFDHSWNIKTHIRYVFFAFILLFFDIHNTSYI